MHLIDTHTHLYLEQFDQDREEVIQRAMDEGVTTMLLPNIDSGSINQMLDLRTGYPFQCLPMMGLHPTSVDQGYEAQLSIVEQELEKGKYVGVGEIGMDLYWDKTWLEQQRDAFRRQLRLARTYKLPVSIHTRDAFEEILAIVREELTDDLKGVFHCFTGTVEQANQVMETGFRMGIGGVLTFKNSGLDKTVASIPLEFLVLETDAPFLAPVPYRGKRNESSYLRLIAEKLANVKGISPEEVAKTTTQTASELFQLKEM